MSRFEDLFHRWQARDMSPGEFDEFGRLLGDESNRDRLYQELRFSGAIVEVLKATEEGAGETTPMGSGGYEPGREGPVRDVPAGRMISWRLWGAMAACLAIAAGLYFVGSRPGRRASESSLTHVAPGSPPGLEAGHEIRTDRDGNAAFSYEGATVRIGPETTLKPKEDRSLHVAEGRFEAVVSSRPKDRPFVVTTPHADIRVTGTRFSVLVLKNSTRVETTEGEVSVTRRDGGDDAKVTAGTFVEAADDGELAAGALPKMKFDLPLRLDCNTLDSPTQPGFTPFPRTPKPSETGYGWTQFRRPLMADRGGPDDLRRDMHYWNGTKTFLARLPNGFYRVTVHFGDSLQPHPNVRVYAEEKLRLAAVSTEKGEFRSETFVVGVFDGELALRFANDKSINASWAISAIEIDRAE
jgi:hypothetical protein